MLRAALTIGVVAMTAADASEHRLVPAIPIDMPAAVAGLGAVAGVDCDDLPTSICRLVGDASQQQPHPASLIEALRPALAPAPLGS
jgi:hypothetical protein